MFRMERRGKWFGGGTSMLYVNESTYQEKKEPEYYIINEQDFQIIRIREEQQKRLMHNCMFGAQMKHHEIEWLVNEGKFEYFDSVDEYITKQQEFYDSVLRGNE
ncbi:hypothetical protein D1872_203200 [compost metagenome]